MVKVTSQITIYEVDGKDVVGPMDNQQLTVHSHRIRREFVVIEVDGKRYTVVAKELLAAIQNGQNTAK